MKVLTEMHLKAARHMPNHRFPRQRNMIAKYYRALRETMPHRARRVHRDRVVVTYQEARQRLENML